jgi:GNAT superfamily N-acetyltransferase
MNDRVVEEARAELFLSTDRSRIDIDATLAMLHDSHWGGDMSRELLERAIEHSVCVGVYGDGRQLAFARAVTDLATYAYYTDVIVADEARGRGIGSWMIESLINHPDLQGFRRHALWTRNASGLYEKFGFSTDMPKSTYMEIRPGPDKKRRENG